ncbi:DNA-(apurinic or apyrimidinic site) endonuclease [Cydia splendana]|uniref:DNA-(apurinic or apyrimidinic site) endonuclease n=1 Tax=Cydia splendana TaxID=1100963 RepID=UPI002127BD6E
MAPRTAKAKKTSNTKIAENEVPKKGRGKTKTVEEPETDVVDTEVVGDVPVIDKKTKRAKKGEVEANGQEETNGVTEEKAPQAKKGRKKKTDTSEESNGVDADEDKTSHSNNESEAQVESNGQAEEVPTSGGRGKKKSAKKEAASKPKSEPKSARGKKDTKQETESEDKEEGSEDLVKPAAKSRGRKAAQKTNKESEPQEKGEPDNEIKESPKKEGRKRGQTKPAKENTPENEQGEQDVEDKPAEEPKKKEPKGRKNNAKKTAKTEDEDEETKPEPASKKRKVAKNDGKGDVKDEVVEEAAAEPKPAKGKRGQKKDGPAEADEAAEAGDTANKRRRKAADEKVSSEDKKSKAPLKNKSSTNYEDIDFSNSSKTVQGKEWNLKISSWNVDGIRAWMNKGGLDYIKYEKPDILCLQETKCAKDKLPDEIANLPGYHAYWQGSDTEGYAGVGIYTTKLAISVQYGLGNEELDADGRMITAEYEQFYLICTYVPNAGRKLVTLPKRLQWNDEFRKYVKALNEKKPVIICGDMNVAHNEIDLANPKANKRNAGFTPEERAGMTDLLGDGLVDSYRHLRPDDTGAYTFWTYMSNARAKNVGWRLDYFLLSERLLPSLCDSVIRSEVYGSDHCPITLFLHVTSADKPKE